MHSNRNRTKSEKTQGIHEILFFYCLVSFTAKVMIWDNHVFCYTIAIVNQKNDKEMLVTHGKSEEDMK